MLLFYIPTLLATLSVLRETPASPPWRLNVVACLSVVVGFILDAPWRSVRRAARNGPATMELPAERNETRHEEKAR